MRLKAIVTVCSNEGGGRSQLKKSGGVQLSGCGRAWLLLNTNVCAVKARKFFFTGYGTFEFGGVNNNLVGSESAKVTSYKLQHSFGIRFISQNVCLDIYT